MNLLCRLLFLPRCSCYSLFLPSLSSLPALLNKIIIHKYSRPTCHHHPIVCPQSHHHNYSRFYFALFLHFQVFKSSLSFFSFFRYCRTLKKNISHIFPPLVVASDQMRFCIGDADSQVFRAKAQPGGPPVRSAVRNKYLTTKRVGKGKPTRERRWTPPL